MVGSNMGKTPLLLYFIRPLLYFLYWNGSIVRHSLLINFSCHRLSFRDHRTQKLEIMNIESLAHFISLSWGSHTWWSKHTGVNVLIKRASSSVSLEKVCGALVGTTTKSPSFASTIFPSSPGMSGTWNRTVPLVTRKVSSCISCQWAGGPGVRGGMMSSTVEMRLSANVRRILENILMEYGRWLTRSTTIFHHPQFYLS